MGLGHNKRSYCDRARNIFIRRLHYDHSGSTAPHTLHEVMDIAINFGVPYDPRDRFRTFDYEHVDRRQRELSNEIDELIDQIKDRWRDLNGKLPDLGTFSTKYQERISAPRKMFERSLEQLEKMKQDFEKANAEERVAIMSSMLKEVGSLQYCVHEVDDTWDKRNNSLLHRLGFR